MVDTPIVSWQGFNLLFELLGVKSMVHGPPRVHGGTRESPRVRVESRMSVMMDLRLGRHILHFLGGEDIIVKEVQGGEDIIVKEVQGGGDIIVKEVHWGLVHKF